MLDFMFDCKSKACLGISTPLKMVGESCIMIVGIYLSPMKETGSTVKTDLKPRLMTRMVLVVYAVVRALRNTCIY